MNYSFDTHHSIFEDTRTRRTVVVLRSEVVIYDIKILKLILVSYFPEIVTH